MEDIQQRIAALDDDELVAAMKQAMDDLEAAATNDPESDWHQACFAGVMTYGQEIIRRGIVEETVH